jgi:uroporphyrinogen-III decarboxylase
MLDMYRRPDKVLEACEKIEPVLLESAIAAVKASGISRAFIPLHKGAEGFMSIDQFKRFYWPGLRKLMLNLIDEGITPFAFIEGNYTSRLEIISDMPSGKAVYHFESTDIFKAKEVLGDHICIRGNVPLALLSTGTPDQVTDYCIKLIARVGKGGGFIMDSAGEMDDAKPENVKAMFDTTRRYGIYA